MCKEWLSCSVILGLSGGIDSVTFAAIAVDALGADAVQAVMMPSNYTSQESLDDATKVASLLGIRLDIACLLHRRWQLWMKCFVISLQKQSLVLPRKISSHAFESYSDGYLE